MDKIQRRSPVPNVSLNQITYVLCCNSVCNWSVPVPLIRRGSDRDGWGTAHVVGT